MELMTCRFKAGKNCISKLCGESSLKVSYILHERFNGWWILTEPFRKGCDGETISARQKFILTPCWLTEALPRVVTVFLSTQTKPVYSLVSSTAESYRSDTECYQFFSSWVAITAEGSFCFSVATHGCSFLALVVPGQLIMELFCKPSQLKQVCVPAWCCPRLAWYKPKPAWSLHNISPAVFPPPPFRLGSSSIWKLIQQSKQKVLGIARRFNVKLLFWMANLIFFMFEVAVTEGTGCHVMGWEWGSRTLEGS